VDRHRCQVLLASTFAIARTGGLPGDDSEGSLKSSHGVDARYLARRPAGAAREPAAFEVDHARESVAPRGRAASLVASALRVTAGSMDKAAGKIRVEGKDYRVQEGGALHVRFEV
jgi:hypothetical protein